MTEIIPLVFEKELKGSFNLLMHFSCHSLRLKFYNLSRNDIKTEKNHSHFDSQSCSWELMGLFLFFSDIAFKICLAICKISTSVTKTRFVGTCTNLSKSGRKLQCEWL